MLLAEKNETVKRAERYAPISDDTQGIQIDIHKNDLKVHPDYQRVHSDRKTDEIAKKWSWLACGVITVGERNGEYWVIDGQHRVIAARKRKEINMLPCIVFSTSEVKDEAKGFLECNTNRKAVGAYDKYRAGLIANDEKCVLIARTCERFGIIIDNGKANRPRSTKCIGWMMDRIGNGRDSCIATLELASIICRDCPITSELLWGLSFLESNIEGGLRGSKFRARLIAVGADALLSAAKKHARVCDGGSPQVWAVGMLKEINRNLRTKFTISEVEA